MRHLAAILLLLFASVASAAVPSYTAGTLTEASNTSSIAPPIPAHNTGDLLLAAIVVQRAGTASTPTDWTLVASSTDSGAPSVYWYRRFAPSSGTTISITFTAGNDAIAQAYAVTGHEPTTPINTFNAAADTASTNITVPSITTSADDCLLFCATGAGSSSPADGANAITTDPSTWGTAIGYGNTYGTAGKFWSKTATTAGSYGGETATQTGTTRDASAIIAIAPAPGGSAVPVIIFNDRLHR